MCRWAVSIIFLSRAFAAVVPRQSQTGIVIPSTSFDSQADFDAEWAYDYPWGTDHNGAARMEHSQVAISDGTLVLTAQPVTGQPPTSSGIAINYLSGTVYAKKTFAVEAGGGYDFTGEFQSCVTRGCWPAFWLTGVDSWPPEIDMAEWKGSGLVSFNTFNTSSSIEALNVAYPNPGNFHTIKAAVRDENGKDISVKFYLDGSLITTQHGKGFIGEPMYLIIDYQMEGSSGSPGPTTSTTYSVRNLEVLSYNSGGN